MTNAVATGLVTQAKAELVITSEDAIAGALSAAITTYAATVETTLGSLVSSVDTLAQSVASSLITIVQQIAVVADPTSDAATALATEFQNDTLAAVETLATAVVASSAADLASVITSASSTLDTAVTKSVNDAAAAAATTDATASNEGYSIPKSISVLETLE